MHLVNSFSREVEVIVGPENVSPWNLIFHFCLSVWLSGFRVATAPPGVCLQAGRCLEVGPREARDHEDGLFQNLLSLCFRHCWAPAGTASASFRHPSLHPPRESVSHLGRTCVLSTTRIISSRAFGRPKALCGICQGHSFQTPKDTNHMVLSVNFAPFECNLPEGGAIRAPAAL